MAIQNQFNEEKVVVANPLGKFIVYLSFLLIIPIIIYIIDRNNMIKAQVKINEADSGIDVQLKKRRDMLGKLVDTVKQSMKFEKDVLTTVTEMRSANIDTMSMKDKADMMSKMDGLQRSINLQMEAYPKLMNDKTVVELEEAIRDVEDNISASRRIYNSNVSYFNQMIQTWPRNVVASGMHLSTKPFFEATEADKKDVDIDLGY